MLLKAKYLTPPQKNIDIILFGNHSSQKTSSSKTHILNWVWHVCVYLALYCLCLFLEASSNVLLYICQEAWLGGHRLHYLYKTAPSLLIHQMKQQNDKISLTKPPHCRLISATGCLHWPLLPHLLCLPIRHLRPCTLLI